jgi:hypothetical protein
MDLVIMPERIGRYEMLGARTGGGVGRINRRLVVGNDDNDVLPL